MNKTPITILQELAIKHGYFPIYDYLNPKNTGNSIEFICKVSCKDLHINGTGKSKKEAKQSAAENMLILLQNGNETLLSSASLVKSNIQNSSIKVEEATSSFVNYIGQLQEFCLQHKLHLPSYDIEESGPQHSRTFLVTIRIKSLQEKGSGHCKKSAKQEGAKNLLEYLKKLKEFPPELSDNNKVLDELNTKLSDIQIDEPLLPIAEQSKKAQAIYIQSKYKLTKVDHNVTIKDTHCLFKQIYCNKISDVLRKQMQDTYNKKDHQQFSIRQIEQDIQTELDIKLEKIDLISSTTKHMICLRLLSIPVITQFGIGNTKDEAELRAAYNIIGAILILLD